MKLLIFLKRYVEMRMILKDNSKNFNSLYNNRKYYIENFGIKRIHQYLDYVEHTKRQVSEISGRKVSDSVMTTYLDILNQYYKENMFDYLAERKQYLEKTLPALKKQLEENAVSGNISIT